MSFHRDEVLNSLHNLQFKVYADSASRTTDSSLLVADIGKVVKQTDTNRYYILINNVGPVWSEITGGGGGSGGINYVSNPNSEDSVADWVTYDDGAVAIPVDGIGSPSANLTISRTTSLPLRGTASFLITKAAGSQLGKGASIPFTLDRADLSKQISIEIDYEALSGWVAGSNGVNSDIEVYVYDITNAVVIQPTPYILTSGPGSQGKFVSTFQSSATSQSYRLILHVATANASAWTFKFDNVRVGPQTGVEIFSPVNDRVREDAMLLPSSGFGTPSAKVVEWWRVGDELHVSAYMRVGTTTSATASVELKAGIRYDTSKLVTTGISNTRLRKVGTWRRIVDTGNQNLQSPNQGGDMYVSDGNIKDIFFGRIANTGQMDQEATNGMLNTNDVVNFEFTIPVAGWGSSVQISTGQDDGRVVACRSELTAPFTITSGFTTVPLGFTGTFPDYDTHAAMASTGIYTFPVSGKYVIAVQLFTADTSTAINQNINANIKYNTIIIAETAPRAFSGQTATIVRLVAEVNAKAGDTVHVEAATNYGAGSTASLQSAPERTFLTIHKVGTGSGLILPSELIAARRHINPLLPDQGPYGSGANQFNMTVLDYDTHGATTASPIGFVAPIAGLYEAKLQLLVQPSTGSWVAGNYIEAFIDSSGGYDASSRISITSTTNDQYTLRVSATFKMNAGDSLSPRLNPQAAQNANIKGNAEYCFFEVHRLV